MPVASPLREDRLRPEMKPKQKRPTYGDVVACFGELRRVVASGRHVFEYGRETYVSPDG